MDFFEISGRLRLSFPLQSELPIFNGMAICFMETPQVRAPPSPPRAVRGVLSPPHGMLSECLCVSGCANVV